MSVDRTLLISAAAALVSAGLLGGCNRNENAGKATGISGTSAVEDGGGDGISSGTGGIGSGPTGTGGAEPADNPGVTEPSEDNGTGEP